MANDSISCDGGQTEAGHQTNRTLLLPSGGFSTAPHVVLCAFFLKRTQENRRIKQPPSRLAASQETDGQRIESTSGVGQLYKVFNRDQT